MYMYILSWMQIPYLLGHHMRMSLTKFRGEMFKILPKLGENDELTLTFEGKDMYTVTRNHQNRKLQFQKRLEKCPVIHITDDELELFKKEGRR